MGSIYQMFVTQVVLSTNQSQDSMFSVWFSLNSSRRRVFVSTSHATKSYHVHCKLSLTKLYIRRLSLIVWVNVVLNRTVVVDSDWRFDNLCVSHPQSQSELYHVSWWYYTLIGQLRHDVIGRLSVKPWCYWLWRLVISDWCVSIRLLSLDFFYT